MHDVGTTYRAYRGDLVQQLQLVGEQHRFVPVLAALVGARVTEVKIRNIERPAGRSNYGLGRTVNVFLDIMYLYFAAFLLRTSAEGVREDRASADRDRRRRSRDRSSPTRS